MAELEWKYWCSFCQGEWKGKAPLELRIRGPKKNTVLDFCSIACLTSWLCLQDLAQWYRGAYKMPDSTLH